MPTYPTARARQSDVGEAAAAAAARVAGVESECAAKVAEISRANQAASARLAARHQHEQTSLEVGAVLHCET